jgi:hypothetical protein
MWMVEHEDYETPVCVYTHLRSIRLRKRPNDMKRVLCLYLANDAEGNPCAIKLKKDSGYCDEYDQVNRYVNWLDGIWCNPRKKSRIIVMNDPSEELKMRVRTDPKIKFYEYSIIEAEKLLHCIKQKTLKT